MPYRSVTPKFQNIQAAPQYGAVHNIVCVCVFVFVAIRHSVRTHSFLAGSAGLSKRPMHFSRTLTKTTITIAAAGSLAKQRQKEKRKRNYHLRFPFLLHSLASSYCSSCSCPAAIADVAPISGECRMRGPQPYLTRKCKRWRLSKLDFSSLSRCILPLSLSLSLSPIMLHFFVAR